VSDRAESESVLSYTDSTGSPGVHWLEDPRTGVWNFDQAGLAVIPTPEEFAYQRTPSYKSPSKDSVRDNSEH